MKRSGLMALALATTALAPFALASHAAAAPVLPTGGKVVAGSASIGSPLGSALTVNQSSGKAIINWSGFSIGQGGTVQFNNGSGATLNRVTGTGLSSIDGLLSGTGSVYLINPNGVIIGKSGVVNVGGTFVASTQDVSNQNFLAGGDLTFSGPSAAAVINYGKVGSLGGDVALIAASVENDGTVTAAKGTAGLVSGYSVLLRDASLDDGKFSVLVGGAGTSVANGGTISAANAELRAEGGNVYALAGDTAGVIRATGVKSGDGKVWLVADGGTTEVAGTIDAQGPNGSAGAIETSGQTVTIDQASLDAHGGTWTLDPTNLEITQTAAQVISAVLGSTDVTETTTASEATESFGGAASPTTTGAQTTGAGDITLDSGAAISWSSTHTLTLSAYHDVDIDGTINIGGAGTLVLYADNAATGQGVASGTVNFGGTAPEITAASGATVNIYYNPVAFSDAATNSTQNYPCCSPVVYTNPYTSHVTGGTMRAWMLVDTLAQLGGGLTGVGSELDGFYALNADIDASSTATANPIGVASGAYGFIPIGYTGQQNNSSAFTGVFDGQGHTISNLYINHVFYDTNNNVQNTDSTGLFGVISNGNAAVENLGLIDPTTNGINFVGTLAGQINSGATASNVYATGVTVTGGYSVGGLTGVLYGGALANAYTTGQVTGNRGVGGLSGQGYPGIITNSYSSAAVDPGVTTEVDYVGGLVGFATGGSTLTNVYATGPVTGGYDVGGLVGQFDGTLTNAYATGAITSAGYSGSDVRFGGLLGEGGGTMSNVYATQAVSAQGGNVGGLIGLLDTSATVTDAYATGAVSGTSSSIGGLIGYANPAYTVSDSFATGSVTSTGGSVGGLIGQSFAGTVSQTYASGAVSGNGNLGGLIGNATDYGNYAAGLTVSDSYATGPVTETGTAANAATTYIGGLVGYSAHDDPSAGATTTLIRDYATGLVSGPAVSGGLIGGYTGVISNSIWDRTTTGQANGFGAQITTYGNNASTPTTSVTNLTSVQDTDPTASDYAFSAMPYTNAGFMFGTTPGGSTTTPWVQIDTDGSINAASGTVATRPMLLMEYATTIVDAHQLQLMQLAPSANYTLANTIDATATATGSDVWSPVYGFVSIGTNATPYSGTFNGQGFSITGLTIHNTGDTDAGLFADFQSQAGATGNVIENVNLVGGTITNTGEGYTGALVGYLQPGGAGASVVNATSSASVSGQNVGGLVGVTYGAISNSSSSGAVTETPSAGFGFFYAGGLVGDDSGAAITNSFATGSVSGTGSNIGGLAGEASGAISNSYATGTVNGGGYQGGLVGDLYNQGSIANSYATGASTSTGYDVGGLVGSSAGVITDSYATGTAAGKGDVGGLVGQSTGSIAGTLSGATGTTYATGAVSAPTNGTFSVGSGVGGLVGNNSGAITGVLATGPVSGSSDVGGLVGDNVGGAISGSYAVGAVSGGTTLGGLVGMNSVFTSGSAIGTGGTITASYATGAVTATGNVAGGLVGENSGAALTDSHATGAVAGGSQVGGLVGINAIYTYSNVAPTITGSAPGLTYASGAVSGTGTSAGGLVGENQGTITQVSYAPVGAGVTGTADVGGLVGLNDAGGTVATANVSGAVSGTSYTGGIVGDNFGALTSVTFLSGSVSGGGGVGGIVGVNEGGASILDANVVVNALSSATVTGTGDDVGGVAGASFGTIGSASQYVTSNATVTGVDHVGGLVGYNSATLDGGASGLVSGHDYVGGLAGLNYAALGNMSVSTTVNGSDYVGGAVGWNGAQGSLSSVFSTATVTASGSYVGGLAGVNEGTIQMSYSGPDGEGGERGSVSGGLLVGGLAGLNRGTISGSSSILPVTGNLYVGGLVGWNDTGAAIQTSYATGSVTGVAGAQEAGTNNDYVGGLVGVNFGSIANAYATGAVSGVQVVGGLVGTNMAGGTTPNGTSYAGGSVSTSYATGAVSASMGAAGASFGVQAGMVSDVYGFPALSGQAMESGYYNTPSASGDGTNLSPSQEDGSAAYTGFDFTNTWTANPDGPPTLQPPPLTN